jgi:hypothetical protein
VSRFCMPMVKEKSASVEIINSFTVSPSA